MKFNRNPINDLYKFLYIMLITLFSLYYVYEITFTEIAEGNKRYVDLLIGIISGTLLTAGVNYLLKDKDDRDKDV